MSWDSGSGPRHLQISRPDYCTGLSGTVTCFVEPPADWLHTAKLLQTDRIQDTKPLAGLPFVVHVFKGILR